MMTHGLEFYSLVWSSHEGCLYKSTQVAACFRTTMETHIERGNGDDTHGDRVLSYSFDELVRPSEEAERRSKYN